MSESSSLRRVQENAVAEHARRYSGKRFHLGPWLSLGHHYYFADAIGVDLKLIYNEEKIKSSNTFSFLMVKMSSTTIDDVISVVLRTLMFTELTRFAVR